MILTGLFFGLAPALRLSAGDIAGTLREDRRTSSVGRGTVRVRNALIVVQVAGSLVLILAAGLFGRSLAAMQRLDTGVDPDRVAWVRPNFSRSGLAPADVRAALEEMRARAEALPGVTRAAFATRLPAQPSGTTTTAIEGYEPQAGTGAVELSFLVVTPQYFETMGQRVLEGRGLAATDTADSDRVILVNQAAARRFWPGRPAVGGRIRSSSTNAPWRTVVGVVEDAPVATFPERPPRPMFYAAAAQSNPGGGYILARTEGDAAALAVAMRTALASVRPSVPLQGEGSLSSHFGGAIAAPRFLARVMGIVSLLAVTLAALGIYAVVAFNVARRSGEMGIRLALGASSRRLVRMIVGEAVATVGLGIAVGLAMALPTMSRLEPLLFGVEPFDVATIAGAVAAIVAVAWLAAYLPARRAASADPARAFRAI
jgi:predicted permease